MPNNKNKNRNRGRNNQNRHFNQNGVGGGNGGGRYNGGGVQDHIGGGGGGIYKRRDGGSGGGHRNNFANRRIYLNPRVIESLEDNFEGEAPHSSNYHARRDDRGKKNRAIDRLKEMGAVKTKLSIGDSEQDAKKTLPESQPHCQLSTVPPDVFQLIVSYVQKYFTCFDSNRESLLEAYNSKCTFSFACNMSNPDVYRNFKFDEYCLKESRNLKKIQGLDDYQHERRFRLLRQGKIDTVNFLTKLPATEHEPTSFKLDFSFFSPNLISFSLNGVFREGKPTDKVRPLRSFQRVFVCIPDPTTQISIINEQFIMSNVTRDQQRKYYPNLDQQSLKQQPSSQPQPDQIPTVSTLGQYEAPVVVAPIEQPVAAAAILQPIMQNLTPEQAQMIQQFSIDSRLNLEWSKHCLDHAQWNYQEAAKQFLEFKDKIPKEAFLVA